MLPIISKLKTHQDIQKILLIGFLLLGILVATALALSPQIFDKQAAEDQINLKLLPSEIQIKKDQVYTVQIGINPLNANITASEIHLEYDLKKISIEDIKIEDFLPVALKVRNDHDGKIQLILGAKLDEFKRGIGILATIKFKALSNEASEIKFTPETKLISEGALENVLKETSPAKLLPAGMSLKSDQPSKEENYPDDLKKEGVIFQDPSPLIRDIIEQEEIKDESIKPGFNFKYIRHVFSNLFSPIASFNKNLEDRTTGVIKGE